MTHIGGGMVRTAGGIIRPATCLEMRGAIRSKRRELIGVVLRKFFHAQRETDRFPAEALRKADSRLSGVAILAHASMSRPD